MKNANISLLYFMKFGELIAVTYFVIYITMRSIEIMNLYHKYDQSVFKNKTCIGGIGTNERGDPINCFENGQTLLIVSMVIVWLHLLHNKLLTNLRLSLAFEIQSPLFCCWNPLNYLICRFSDQRRDSCNKKWGLETLCEDKWDCCNEGTGFIISGLKHIAMGTYLFYVRLHLNNFADVMREEEDWIHSLDLAYLLEWLGVHFMVFALQFPIFLAGRFAIITVINLIFCGCLCWDDDHIRTADSTVVDLDPYQDHIISLNYEKYTMLTRNSADADGVDNFQAQLRDLRMVNEIRRTEPIQNLRESRRQAQVNQGPNLASSFKQGGVKGVRNVMREQVIKSLRLQQTQDCPICLMEFEEGEKVSVLGCNINHFMHEQCANVWLNKKMNCPMCRAPVKMSDIKKKVYKGLMKIEPVELENIVIEDAKEVFQLDEKKAENKAGTKVDPKVAPQVVQPSSTSDVEGEIPSEEQPAPPQIQNLSPNRQDLTDTTQEIQMPQQARNTQAHHRNDE